MSYIMDLITIAMFTEIFSLGFGIIKSKIINLNYFVERDFRESRNSLGFEIGEAASGTHEQFLNYVALLKKPWTNIGTNLT